MDTIARSVSKTKRLIVVEDCMDVGCVGRDLVAKLSDRGVTFRSKLLNLGTEFTKNGDMGHLYAENQIDVSGIYRAFTEE